MDLKIGDILHWGEDYSHTDYRVTDFRNNSNHINPYTRSRGGNAWKLEWFCDVTGKNSHIWEPESNLREGLSEGWIVNTSVDSIRHKKSLVRHDF